VQYTYFFNCTYCTIVLKNYIINSKNKESVEIMISTSDFLTTILKDILGLPLVGDIYEKVYKVSRNIFSIYIGTNKRLGKRATNALKKIILHEIKKDENKKVQILQFMNAFLSEKEKQTLKDASSIVEIVVSKYTKQPKQSNNEIEIVGIYELVNRGWTLESYMEECFKFWDSITETGLMPDEHKGFVDQWVGLIKQQHDNYKILLDSHGQMIGFWDFLALFDDAFSKAKKGQLVDADLSVDIMPVMIPGTYNIYVTSIMLKDEYRKSLAFQKLLFSIIDTIEEYALNSIFIDEVCAWAYSDSGIALSKTLGLTYITEHKEHGKVYCGRVIELLNKPFCSKFTMLKKLYLDHFQS